MASRSEDIAARHQHFLERFKTGQGESFEAFLRKADDKISTILQRAGSIQNRAELRRLQSQVREALRLTYTEWTEDLSKELLEFATDEASFELETLQKLTDAPLRMPSNDAIRLEAFARPLDSKQVAKVFKDFATEEADRVSGAVRQGFFDGRTTADIVKDIRGTKALQFKDGELHKTLINAKRIARTTVQHFSSVARHQTFIENGDFIQEYRWVSTLDGRTSTICQALSGRVFKIGDGPLPPAHPNCRSAIAAVIEDEDEVIIDDTGTRRVEGSKNYGKWLKQQSKGFQDEALGKTKAELFRKGDLPIERFVDRNNDPLTLVQLRRLYPKAWDKAGLNNDEG